MRASLIFAALIILLTPLAFASVVNQEFELSNNTYYETFDSITNGTGIGQWTIYNSTFFNTTITGGNLSVNSSQVGESKEFNTSMACLNLIDFGGNNSAIASFDFYYDKQTGSGTAYFGFTNQTRMIRIDDNDRPFMGMVRQSNQFSVWGNVVNTQWVGADDAPNASYVIINYTGDPVQSNINVYVWDETRTVLHGESTHQVNMNQARAISRFKYFCALTDYYANDGRYVDYRIDNLNVITNATIPKANLTYNDLILETQENKFVFYYENMIDGSVQLIINETHSYDMDVDGPYANYSLNEYHTGENLTIYITYDITDNLGNNHVGNTSEQYNLTQYTTGIGLYNCSPGDHNITLSLNSYLEISPADRIISTMRTAIQYWTNNEDVTKNFTTELEGKSAYDICMNTNQTIQANIYINYNVSEGFTHRYYSYNASLTNSTPLNISMYNYNSITGVSNLKITLRERGSYAYYPNIIGSLMRYYVGEGVYRTVQMDESDDFGLIFYNVIEESVDYRIQFKDRQGHVLRLTDNMKFVCDSGICDITFLLSLDDVEGIIALAGTQITYSNETGNITLTWNDPTAITTSARLLVTKEQAQTTTICDITKAGSIGTTTCDVSAYEGEVLVRVYTTTNPETPLISKWIRLPGQTIGRLLGPQLGSWWAFIVLGVIISFGALMGPAAAVIVSILGLIMISWLGIFTGITLTFIIFAAVIGIAIGIKVKKE